MRLDKGIFIVFEGGEGAGKTTQINHLAEALTQKKYHVKTTREPGGTPESDKIRNLLVQRDGGNWSSMAELLLLYAARTMHVENVIKPELAEGKIVISDRFSDSTRAYQGYAGGVPLQTIDDIDKIVLDHFKQDLTFVFDLDPKVGVERSQRRLASATYNVDQLEDRFENLEISYHERLRDGFLDLAQKDPGRYCVIDASQSEEDIAAQVLARVMEQISS